MKTLSLDPCLNSSELKQIEGTKPVEAGYTILKEDCNVQCKQTGKDLLRFRKGILSKKNVLAGYNALKDSVRVSDNRGVAGGILKHDVGDAVKGTEEIGSKSRYRYRVKKKDGTLSNTNRANPVASGIVGYWGRDPRFPYCRQCVWNIDNEDKWKKAIPLIKEVDGAYWQIAPEDWELQRAEADKIHDDFRISNTVFSTLTVNKNWQTAIHTDKGNLISTNFSGLMTAFSAGKYTGCYTVFPQYKVGVDLRSTDLLLFNNHLHHGNTPLVPKGSYERISVVFYMRDGMQKCLSAEEELKIAKTRKSGTPIY